MPTPLGSLESKGLWLQEKAATKLKKVQERADAERRAKAEKARKWHRLQREREHQRLKVHMLTHPCLQNQLLKSPEEPIGWLDLHECSYTVPLLCLTSYFEVRIGLESANALCQLLTVIYQQEEEEREKEAKKAEVARYEKEMESAARLLASEQERKQVARLKEVERAEKVEKSRKETEALLAKQQAEIGKKKVRVGLHRCLAPGSGEGLALSSPEGELCSAAFCHLSTELQATDFAGGHRLDICPMYPSFYVECSVIPLTPCLGDFQRHVF